MKPIAFIISFAFIFSIGISSAQNTASEITYCKMANQEIDTSSAFSIHYYKDVTYLSDAKDIMQGFIDYKRKMIVDIIKYDDNNYKSVEVFDSLPQANLKEESEVILGYTCKKVAFSSFSNNIEVWYTEETDAKGSPYKYYLPNNGLVLKVMINGGRTIIATQINENVASDSLTYLFDESITINQAEYRELQIKSRFTNISVFDKQQINWGDSIINPEPNLLNEVYRFAGGTVIMKKIKLPEISKKGAQVFATLTNWSNGDAYDRTGSLFTINGKKDKSILDAYLNGIEELPVFTDNMGDKYQGFTSTNDYETPTELMRFFTSFGVNHFNNKRPINNYHWQDSVVYKQEITRLIPNDEDEIWIGVVIGNYDGGGHFVSLDLQYYPAWDPENIPSKYIDPLFCTLNSMEMLGQNYGRLFGHDTLSAEFEIPEGLKNLELLFTSTGHGGWGGGDEFNPKLNQIFIDGQLVYSIVPWRTDCGTYRMSNPASGNFKNGLSSSDLSRSNWCPATLTPPYLVPLKDISPGKHIIEVVIDQGEKEGNSFSAWSVSGVLVGEWEK